MGDPECWIRRDVLAFIVRFPWLYSSQMAKTKNGYVCDWTGFQCAQRSITFQLLHRDRWYLSFFSSGFNLLIRSTTSVPTALEKTDGPV